MKDIYAVQRVEAEEVGAGKNASRSKTVAQQFKDQLNTLMERIESTEPHYIRCLKPNDAAKPKLLTRKRLTEQLRYGGVLEAVRVARLGFPVRLEHAVFFTTYRILLPSISEDVLTWRLDTEKAQNLCIRLLDLLLEESNKKFAAQTVSDALFVSRADKVRSMLIQPIPMNFPKTDVQLGITKVFLRKPAHDALEAHRVFHQNAAATIIQAFIRGSQKRIQFIILRNAALVAERFYRGCKGRERCVLFHILCIYHVAWIGGPLTLTFDYYK
jgi:myosin-5